MYLGYQNNKIKFYVQEPLNPNFYNVDKWEETEDEYALEGDEYIKVDAEYIAQKLQEAKEKKYNEANNGAKFFLESGNALFEFEEGKHIEATDGNIAKLTAYALAFVTGQLQPTDKVVWNTKEDETVELSQEQIVTIINGLGTVQALVWSVQFPRYVQMIETAETIEEVETIEIVYTSDIPQEEVENDI
ncbi:hypothetical protein [Faecalibacillus faecis]|uniref:hypothetical protein n=1 Tax=Faecalibacillus faecis TaxID=1982628 RepID=UPI00386C7C5F